MTGGPLQAIEFEVTSEMNWINGQFGVAVTTFEDILTESSPGMYIPSPCLFPLTDCMIVWALPKEIRVFRHKQ